MPALVRPRGPDDEDPLIRVPRRVGLALRPSANREAIPEHVALSTNAPPYSGEVYEQQTGRHSQFTPLAVGQTMAIVSLRRAWKIVGFIVDPGDAVDGGDPFHLQVNLRVLTRGLNGDLPFATVPTGQGPVAFVNLVIGARVELRVRNSTTNPVFGVKASIWGMSST